MFEDEAKHNVTKTAVVGRSLNFHRFCRSIAIVWKKGASKLRWYQSL